jgi:uncharacterized RDD family membrane protein YckC
MTQRISLIMWNELVNAAALAGIVATCLMLGFSTIAQPDAAGYSGLVLGVSLYVVISAWIVRRTGWFSGGPWSEYRVVDRSGSRPPWRQILLRQLLLAAWCAFDVCLLLPTLLFGPFIVAGSKNHLGVYDMVAGTRLSEPAVTPPGGSGDPPQDWSPAPHHGLEAATNR